jgi:class 3 adenylate cyclase/predicted ATPase
MTFDDILDQAIEILQRRGRVTYRTLKRLFNLDDEALEDLKDELLFSHPVIDEAGRGLVWTGETETTPEPGSVSPPDQPEQRPTVQEDHLSPPEPPTPDAERRQLTVMFCDLVDSTPLSEQLDPEDLREVLRAYQQTCAEVVQRFDGHIAQYLGDALLIYFGWPLAHEDDTHRAVQTGLEMLEAMQTLNTRLEQDQGIRLAIRVGIHTGLVVVGEMGGGGRHENLATGETVNIAARLEGLAPSNAVIISHVTARLVERAFHLEALGLQVFRGVADPMPVFRVHGPMELHEDETGAVGVPFLVGRDEEIGLLLRRWEQSKVGLGQVVLLCGEGGIGKSALVAAVRHHIVTDVHTRITFRCSSYHTNSALYPVITHLEHRLRFDRDDTPGTKLDKLEQGLRTYGFALDETIPLLADLLSVPLLDRYPPLTLAPQRQRQQTLETLVAWLLAETVRHPVLLVVEDLHWIDPSTLEMLNLLIERIPTVPMLILLTFRPEFQPPWPTASHMLQLTLDRLSPQQAEHMARYVAGGKSLPANVIQQVIVQTDGVPLFVEEVTKAVLESGLLQEQEEHYTLVGPLTTLAIPVTLHDALMARLDRLGTAKTVAQLGATLGRNFRYEVLRAFAALDETILQEALARLVVVALLTQRGRLPQTVYTFKHALIQDAAYQSLLRSTRQQYHQRIAQVLTEQFPQTVETQPELLAYHSTEADLKEQAIGFWLKAGQRAIQRSANAEAIGHLEKGLEVLEAMPDTPERRRHELLLNITLGAPLLATKGYAAQEVGKVFTRARELCSYMEDTPQLFQVLQGLWGFHCVRSELRLALELGEQLVSLAQRLQDTALLLEASGRLGISLFLRGDLEPAREYLVQSITLYDPSQHRSHAFLYGQDPQVACLCHAAWVLWLLGYPDQALQRSREALELARELAHPFSLSWAHLYAALTHTLRQEWGAAQAQAEALITLGREQGFAYRLAQGRILQGWALVQQGQHEGAIDQMRESLAIVRATGAQVYCPYFQALLAKAYGEVGQPAEGLTLLAEVMAAIDTTDERFYAAGLYRLKGDLLLTQSDDNHREAEASFRQALDIARHQQAKSLALQAAMSLGRLWQRQGRRAEAHHLLAAIYNGLTEGWDTTDLREARALLAELA